MQGEDEKKVIKLSHFWSYNGKKNYVYLHILVTQLKQNLVKWGLDCALTEANTFIFFFLNYLSN